jgi:metal-responsive CopG/Arc/MetJ family transcriptional regulator
MVQLNDRLLSVLDRHAERKGISRSALIRAAL